MTWPAMHLMRYEEVQCVGYASLMVTWRGIFALLFRALICFSLRFNSDWSSAVTIHSLSCGSVVAFCLFGWFDLCLIQSRLSGPRPLFCFQFWFFTVSDSLVHVFDLFKAWGRAEVRISALCFPSPCIDAVCICYSKILLIQSEPVFIEV